ncbi:sulfite exporter TauE/SafE family protein [Aliiroseovarius sp. S253]|uniref:sulfite exporter TauE/SafE family protein n=1 Tax=Aliiroseovarius sp. S253 TaxID=3415133 RepID=UPI003C7B728C
MISTSILNLSPYALVLAGIVIFAASFARGYSGFGFSAILMVGLLPIFPAAQLVPLSIALEILASCSQAPRILPQINRRFLAVLLAASLIGAPAGVFLLSYFSEHDLRLFVYCIVFASTASMLLFSWRPFSVTIPGLFLAGLVAGVVNGATALSGMVLALFFTSTTIASHTMRATMIAYLFFTDILTGGLLLAADHYDMLTLWRILVAIPIMLLGIWLGSRHFFSTPAESFKTRVMWLLLFFCVAGAGRLVLG